MLTAHGIFTESELYSRRDIMLENYTKTVNIEANTMIDMTRKEILPAVLRFTADTAQQAAVKKQFAPNASCACEQKIVEQLSALTDEMDKAAAALEEDVAKLHSISDVLEASAYVRDTLVPAMAALRSAADQAETLTAESYYPFPAYDQLLFGV